MSAIATQFTAIITAIMMYLGLWSILPANVVENVPELLDNDIRVMSINLLSVGNDDPEKSLTTRSQLVVDLINEYQPDSFGVQEGNLEWLWILKANLSDYVCVSQTRTSSISDETTAIFYLKDKYNLIDSDTFWLSETPDVIGSSSFDSVDPRICTWVTLENKETGEIYSHVNTHLDFAYSYTREAQTAVLLDGISNLIASDYPIVCTGDFNATQNSAVYQTMTSIFNDTKYLAVTSDSGQTYHGMDTYLVQDSLIYDYIFVSSNVEVQTYKIVDEKINDLNYSDHYAICADFNFIYT